MHVKRKYEQMLFLFSAKCVWAENNVGDWLRNNKFYISCNCADKIPNVHYTDTYLY